MGTFGTGGAVAWSISKMLEKWSVVHPEKPALIIDGIETTYGQLNEISNRVAHYLLSAGLARGDRVAAVARNSIEAVASYFACAKIGTICVPINNRLLQDEIAFQVKDAGVSALIFAREFRDVIEPGARSAGLEPRRLLCIDALNQPDEPWFESFHGRIAEKPVENPVLDNPPVLDDPLAIIYTSGTTGNPKGAVVSNLQTYFKCMQVTLSCDMREDDVHLTHVPFFHSGGLFMALTPAIFRGNTMVSSPRFDAARFIEDARRYKPTLTGGATTMIKMILAEYDGDDNAFDSVRQFSGGGERTPLSFIEEVREKTGLTFQMTYGQTENSFMTLVDKPSVTARSGSVGRAGFFSDIWIEDENGDVLGPNEPGMITARGPTVMTGYWNLPEKTAEAIVDGKLRTGDIGYMDEDAYIYLVDRDKDMYRSGAENVYPAEVEKLLMNHPKVFNVAIIGVADDTWGEVGKAFVVPRPGSAIAPEELLAFLEGKVARYKFPKHFEFIDKLPTTETGKVRKVTLKDREGRSAHLANDQ